MAKHPHAELIKQMVDDDSLQAECSVRLGKWTLASVTSCPEYDWRLFQPKPKTITIVANGKEYVLPEPMRDRVIGKEFFVAEDDLVLSFVWDASAFGSRWLAQRRCHATREAAQAWVDAMAEIRGAK